MATQKTTQTEGHVQIPDSYSSKVSTVMEDKEKLKNCHRLKETKMTQLNVI